MKYVLIAVAVVAALSACTFVTIDASKPKGPQKTVTYDITDFDGIIVNGAYDVDFTQGDNYLVEITTAEDFFEKLEVERTQKGYLKLSTKPGSKIRSHVGVKVTAPSLTFLNLNGAGDVDIESGLRSESPLKIEVNGAGDLEMKDIRCADLAIAISGAGDVDVDNLTCGDVSVSVSGAGDIDLTGLDVEKVKLALSGAGDALLAGKAASAHLSISGAGTIDAKGLECPEIEQHASGMAKIRH